MKTENESIESLDLWKGLLSTGLREDGWPWDWTTLGTRKSKTQKLHARVYAKSDGVWAAESLVHALNSMTSDIQARSRISDGDKFKPGALLVEMKGLSHQVLAYERPFLNLAAYVSGVATATSRLVEIVRKACPKNTPRVTLTRKTLPGYRDIAIHGVRVGGGHPHRVSLAGGILIKENHIAAAGSISKAISQVRKIAPHGLKVEIEVQNEKELKQALSSGADGILLDNFSPEQVLSAVKFVKEQTHTHPFLEVSGGLTEATIASYAIEGIHVLSVGSLSHSVKSADFTLLVQ